jgi:hypothetical protein
MLGQHTCNNYAAAVNDANTVACGVHAPRAGKIYGKNPATILGTLTKRQTLYAKTIIAARTDKITNTTDAAMKRAKRSVIILTIACTRLWTTRNPTYSQARFAFHPSPAPTSASVSATA